MHLTSSQQWAIAHDGRNLQLIACAGSGKTEVVARRVVHLLQPNREESLVPGNIHRLHLHETMPGCPTACGGEEWYPC